MGKSRGLTFTKILSRINGDQRQAEQQDEKAQQASAPAPARGTMGGHRGAAAGVRGASAVSAPDRAAAVVGVRGGQAAQQPAIPSLPATPAELKSADTPAPAPASTRGTNAAEAKTAPAPAPAPASTRGINAAEAKTPPAPAPAPTPAPESTRGINAAEAKTPPAPAPAPTPAPESTRGINAAEAKTPPAPAPAPTPAPASTRGTNAAEAKTPPAPAPAPTPAPASTRGTNAAEAKTPPPPAPASASGAAPARPQTPAPQGPPVAPPRPSAAAPTRDETFDRIVRIAADYEKIINDVRREVQVSVVLGLCEVYLRQSQRDEKSGRIGGPAQERARVNTVETIYAEARRDRSRRQAQQQYVKDVEKTSTPTADGTDTNLKNLDASTAKKVVGGAQSVVAGNTDYENEIDDATLDLVAQYGLTQAEVLAIRVYTAEDYKYINPFVAQDSGWMKSVKDGKTADQVKGIQEEAGLHAGVAMMAMAKLPVQSGTVYRGARMNKDQFEKIYPDNGTTTFGTFTSTSTLESAARNFADGRIGDLRPDQTISVMAEFKVHDARDISALSIVSSENEWLLPPGSKFTVKVKEVENGEPGGEPHATKWRKVFLTQVKDG